MANVQLFQFEGNQIAYRKFGHGPAVLLAFHGFGQTSQVYLSVGGQVGNQFTVFAVDLFFHGDSHYADRQILSKPKWWQLIEAFLYEQRIERFSLLGFSLGGRFVLVTAEYFAHRLDQLLLIAPDGIRRNVWYTLATRSGLGRGLFRYVMRHLSILNGFGHALTQIGLLNRTVMRFVELSLNTSEQREHVYLSWTQFRHIQSDLDKVSSVLADYSVRVRLFTGAFDRLVPGMYTLPLTKRLRHYELTILKTGHNRLIELAAEKLIQPVQ